MYMSIFLTRPSLTSHNGSQGNLSTPNPDTFRDPYTSNDVLSLSAKMIDMALFDVLERSIALAVKPATAAGAQVPL